MFCNKCGAQLDDNSAFCHKCGQPTAVGTVPAVRNKNGYNKKVKIVSVIAAAAIVITGLVIWAVVSNNNSKAHEQQMREAGQEIAENAALNARIKCCKSNQRIIKGNLETYVMTGGPNGEPIVFPYGDTVISETMPRGFLMLFDGGQLPICPADPDSSYYICVHVEAGKTEYIVRCTGKECEKHNN